MTTPEAPAHQSIAEAVLAEVQATQAAQAAPAEPQNVVEEQEASPAPEEEGEVEIEEQLDEAPPRTRSLSWDDAVKQVPPDIAKLMKELRSDYTRKTQALAEQRREFIREREALLKGKQALTDPEDVPEYDPFNEASITARIEQEVNRRLREVLEPMQAEYEQMAAEESYQRFLSDHPDFQSDTDLRSEVQHLLESNEALDLETAYWAAKGKQHRLKAQADKDAARAKRHARKEAAMKGIAPARRGTSKANKPSRTELKRMSASDILALAQSMHRK